MVFKIEFNDDDGYITAEPYPELHMMLLPKLKLYGTKYRTIKSED